MKQKARCFPYGEQWAFAIGVSRFPFWKFPV